MEQGKQEEMTWTLRERWDYTKPLIRHSPLWVVSELMQLHRLVRWYERKVKFRKWVRRIRHWWSRLDDGA